MNFQRLGSNGNVNWCLNILCNIKSSEANDGSQRHDNGAMRCWYGETV